MIHKVISVLDSKSEVYALPQYMVSRGVAQRSWLDAIKDPNSPFHKHPEDYTMYELGEYDDSCGQFLQHDHPVSLGNAATLL